MSETFDTRLRAQRRDRAARTGLELFLLERAFSDCLERVELGGGKFERALLLGCPDPGWRVRLEPLAGAVEVRDPGPLFARAAGGEAVVEDDWLPGPQSYDLVLAMGTLDTVNGLPLALRLLFESLAPNGLLLGAMSGGDTLPVLRAAMQAADEASGAGAAAHAHPRIEAAAVAPLLEQAGFVRPVIDVDRVPVAYSSFARLVADLRGMAATNLLVRRSAKPVLKTGLAAAKACFGERAQGGRTTETFEILHFAAWRPAQG